MKQATGGTKEAWASRVGVILAVTGSAVGLGNFLRFPGQAAQYGGGAFMIPYAVAFLLLGLPIAWVEWAMGRYGGAKGYNSSPGIYRAIWKSRLAPYLGVLSMVIPVMIYMYYVYIEAWCLAYACRYLHGGLALGADPDAYSDFFSGFIGMNQDGHAFDILTTNPFGSAVFYLIICFAINFILIYRGLTKGIEWFCKWAMPALFICAAIILVRVLTLPPNPAAPEQNIINGLGFMWNPTQGDVGLLTRLADPEVWLAAAGQIFFSLSVGFGIIITYSSYLKKDDDIALSSLTAAAGNGFCEVVLGGLITIPAAFIFLGPVFLSQNAGSSFQLGFVALPNVFNQMYAGSFFGFLFFFLLFLAAVTSSLSMLQPAIAFLEEGLGLKRRASVALLGMLTALGATFIVFFSKDLAALDTIDFWIGTFFIFVLATIQVILFGWVLGVDRGFEELQRGAEIRIPSFVKFVIKYVSPVYLLGIFGLWVYYEIVQPMSDPDAVTRLSQIRDVPLVKMLLGVIVIVMIFFLLLIAESVKRWRAIEAEQQETSS